MAMMIPRANTPQALQTLRQRRAGIQSKIDARTKAGATSTPGFTKRLGNINSRIDAVRAKNNMPLRRGSQSPAAAPTTDTNPIQSLPLGPWGSSTTPAASEPSQDTLSTLFPNTRMFEPENYQGSPLYQFQLQEGQKQLGKSLAARGLSNSGYGIEQELNIPLKAAAQDTDRMTRIASENADRLYNIQNNEALRRERAGNNQWDRTFNIAELMSRESPWNAAIGGLDAYADTTGKQGQSQADFLRNFYRRVIPNGGGGGSTRPPIALPSGPDYSNIMPSQISGGASSNNGWMNILGGLLGNIF